MKAVFCVLTFLGLVLVGYLFLLRGMTQDPGKNILIAYNEDSESQVSIHVSVTTGTFMRDPPKFGPKGKQLVSEWVENHFELRDATGKALRLERWGSDALIAESRANISAEMYLVAVLDKGKAYSFDFIPFQNEPAARYRYEFTAPSEEKEAWHVTFLPVAGR